MFGRDNPGGEWLSAKRERAAERMNPAGQGIGARGLGGPTTAWTLRPVMADTGVLQVLPGVNRETRAPGDHQYDALALSVEEHGWRDDQMGNAILIGVNHLGEAYLIEGNTRVALARDIGIESVRCDIRWYNGAEREAGPFSLADGRQLSFCHPYQESEDIDHAPR